MSLKSGWCMDEVQYLDIDPDYSAKLHDRCRSANCTCKNHDKDTE